MFMNQINRVIINTVAQYVRIVSVIFITLYSTRIVLSELGNSDFGLYSLIGSVLAFLSFLNTTIIKSTQRYLSFYIGKDDFKYQKKVLFNSVLLNFVISFITCAVIMVLEPFIINNFLNIEVGKVGVAKSLYLLMCLGVFFTINLSPYNAVFVSHENIVFSSAIYIMAAILRLLAAFSLDLFSTHKLLWYGVFMCGISFLEFVIYYISAKIKYSECRDLLNVRFYEPKLMKSILSFSFWNLYGSLCIIGRNQGYAFVINKFMAITANAAYGIANQVSGQINNFVYSLSNAISPIITRSEGAEDHKRMIELSIYSSKYAVFMFSFIAIPVIVDLDYILKLWLVHAPEYTSIFITSIVLACMCDSYASGLRTGILAKGKIKWYSLCVYSIKILSLPISIILIVSGIEKAFILVPYIVTEILGSIITILFFYKYTRVLYLRLLEDLVKSSFPLLVSAFCAFAVCHNMQEGTFRFIMLFITTTIVTLVTAYFFSMTQKERQVIKSVIQKFAYK